MKLREESFFDKNQADQAGCDTRTSYHILEFDQAFPKNRCQYQKQVFKNCCVYHA